jgi:hypothetical protein
MTGAAEKPTALEGTRQSAGHYLGAEARLSDLIDIEVGAIEEEVVLQAVAEFVDDLAAAADYATDLFCPQANLGALWSAVESQAAKTSALGLPQ